MYSGAAVLAIGLGYILAMQASSIISARRLEQQPDSHQQREEVTEGILQHMNTIAVGDTLPDHQFEGLDRRPMILSQMVSHKTVLVFFDPDCGSCGGELESIHQAVTRSSDYRYFLLISAGNPRMIEDMQGQYDIRSPILYDHGGKFVYGHQILTYPFNVIVDRDLVIEDIIGGSLDMEELREIIDINARAESGNDVNTKP